MINRDITKTNQGPAHPDRKSPSSTNQSVYDTERREVAVLDHCISSMAVGYRQVPARSLVENKILSYLPALIGISARLSVWVVRTSKRTKVRCIFTKPRSK
jgi:hypothetical protein